MGFDKRFPLTGKCLFSLVGIGAMVVLGANRAAQAQLEDDDGEQVTNNTGSSQSEFTEVFEGNVQTSDTVEDSNPFSGGSTSVTLDGSGNTDVTYSGNPVSPGATISPSLGLSGSSAPPNGLQLLAQYWGGSPSLSVPVASVTQTTLPTSPVKYAVVYVTISPDLTGQWFELPYTPTATAPKINFANNDGNPITLSNAGFQLSNTMIPLDDLNFNAEPPPGQPGSQFMPLPALDGSTLQSGGSQLVDLPEPASMVIVVIGAAGLMSRRRRI